MFAGAMAGRVLLGLEAAHVLPSGLLLTTVPPIAVEYLMYAVALFGFRIFDPIPLARQVVIQPLHSGILVLDSRGRVTT